jgi:hypothetical protein
VEVGHVRDLPVLDAEVVGDVRLDRDAARIRRRDVRDHRRLVPVDDDVPGHVLELRVALLDPADGAAEDVEPLDVAGELLVDHDILREER